MLYEDPAMCSPEEDISAETRQTGEALTKLFNDHEADPVTVAPAIGVSPWVLRRILDGELQLDQKVERKLSSYFQTDISRLV